MDALAKAAAKTAPEDADARFALFAKALRLRRVVAHHAFRQEEGAIDARHAARDGQSSQLGVFRLADLALSAIEAQLTGDGAVQPAVGRPGMR